jgi:hypothetical protein
VLLHQICGRVGGTLISPGPCDTPAAKAMPLTLASAKVTLCFVLGWGNFVSGTRGILACSNLSSLRIREPFLIAMISGFGVHYPGPGIGSDFVWPRQTHFLLALGRRIPDSKDTIMDWGGKPLAQMTHSRSSQSHWSRMHYYLEGVLKTRAPVIRMSRKVPKRWHA